MNLTFSDEQEMLRDSAREFLQSKYPVERVAEIADGEGFDPSSWSEVAELGWTGISLPEDAGGAGMSFLEEMVVIEELGRAVYPGPFFSTVVLALPALSLAPELLESVVAGKSAATLAWAGADGRFEADGLAVRADGDRLSGTALFVPDLAVADQVVVAAQGDGGAGLWLVGRDGEGASWEDLPTVDTTRRLGALTLSNAPGRVLAEPGSGGAVPTRERRAAPVRTRRSGGAAATTSAAASAPTSGSTPSAANALPAVSDWRLPLSVSRRSASGSVSSASPCLRNQIMFRKCLRSHAWRPVS